MENTKFPNIPKELLDELEKRFPDMMPDAQNIEDFRFKQGQVSVIRFLKVQFHSQNQNILET